MSTVSEGEREVLERAQVIDLIDQLAREWDGCEYEAPGGPIDIGDAIRTAGYRRVHRLFDAAASIGKDKP